MFDRVVDMQLGFELQFTREKLRCLTGLIRHRVLNSNLQGEICIYLSFKDLLGGFA